MIDKPDEVLARFLGLPQLWPEYGSYRALLHLHHPQRRVEGVLIDLFHQYRIPGYSATVWLVPPSRIPNDVQALLQIPKEVFDTPLEIVQAGWLPILQMVPFI